MSAYICDKKHIVYLIQGAMARTWHHGDFHWYVKDDTKPYGARHEVLPCGDFIRAAEVANILWLENIESVSYRYPRESSDTLPGPHDKTLIQPADIGHAGAIDPVQMLKSISCFEYQSCEHPGWKKSSAWAFCNQLRHAAISALPGYDEAAWGAPENRRMALA